MNIFEVLLPWNHSLYFDAGSMKFFIKLSVEKKHENIQMQVVVPEILGKMLIKVTGVG